MLDKRVVLLGSTFCQRLEPVCIMGHTVLRGPLLHAFCHDIGHLTVQARAVVHHINHRLVDILWQILVHLLTVKDLFAKILSGSLTRCFYVERLLLESLTDNLKS